MKSSKLSLIPLEITNSREYRDSLIHDWILPTWIAETNLQVYMVRWLDSQTLMKCIKDGEMTVGRDFYSIIWLNSPQRIKKEGKALLSFRFCKHMDVGYCLVKSFSGSNLKQIPQELDLDSVRIY